MDLKVFQRRDHEGYKVTRLQETVPDNEVKRLTIRYLSSQSTPKQFLNDSLFNKEWFLNKDQINDY